MTETPDERTIRQLIRLCTKAGFEVDALAVLAQRETDETDGQVIASLVDILADEV